MNKSLDKFKKTVEAINSEYATLHSLTNDELRMRYFYLEQFVNEQKDKTRALDKSLPSVYALVKETARRFSIENIEVNATPNDLYLAEKYDFLEIL